MKCTIAALILATTCAAGASAQQYASNEGYRVCSPAANQQGLKVASDSCGRLTAPNFSTINITSESDLRTLLVQRDTFRAEVKEYGQCVTQLINSFRRPGAPADSTVPDEAACAHSWAQDQQSKVVREFGSACNDYSNRSAMDSNIEFYDGRDCYLPVGSRQG